VIYLRYLDKVNGSILSVSGYGHLAPATTEGRIFCMIFAFFGIPLNLMILKSIGDRINDVIHYVHYHITVQMSDGDDVTVKTRTIAWTLGFMIMTLLVGAILYSQTQNWTFFEALYFCFVTFSTIGFGDLVPNEGQLFNDKNITLNISYYRKQIYSKQRKKCSKSV